MEEPVPQYPFLRGAGEMGDLINAYPWGSASIGQIEQWPLSLKTTLGIMLHSAFPMFLFWGKDLTCFYNDAFRPSLGIDGKHPAIGKNGIEVWPEIWEFIGPLIEGVMKTGEPVWFEDQLVPFYRNGKIEDIYWTFSYSPAYDDNGEINGVYVVCNETTDKVSIIKNLESSKHELEFAIDATELGVWDLNPATGKFTGNDRLKEWFGLTPVQEIPLEYATNVIKESDRQYVINAIADALQYESGGKYDEEYTIINPHTNQERVVQAKGRAWFDDNGKAYRFNGTLQDITDIAKAQIKIAEAKHLTDLATKSAGLGLFWVDLTTGKIDYTPAFAEIITGDPTKKEISRRSFVNHVHPDDLADRAAAIEQGNKTGDFYYYSPRVIWDDGTIHRIMVMGANAMDASGNPISFSGTVRDITQLENQRIALEEAQLIKRDADARFLNVTNSSPTGLWLSDENGGLIYLNKTLVEWTGMPYEDLLGNGWTNAIIDKDRERSILTFNNALATKSHYDVVFRISKGNGKIIWCRAAGDPYYNEDGSFAGYSGFCMDVDEIISGRMALSESEERFRSMIANAPVGTCLFTGRDMIIDVANDLMLSYWGKGASVIGQPLAKALPELIGQPFLAILDNVYTSGELYEVTAAPVQLNINGKLDNFYFDFTYKPLFNAAGEVYGIMDMAVDVTEQVLAARSIEENQRQLLALFEESAVAIAIIRGEDLSFTMVNPFYAELVGRKPEQLVNKTLLDALPELAGQGFDKLLEQVLETGIAYVANEVAVTLERKEKLEEIYVDLTYQPRFEKDGAVSGIFVVATDVTQQVLSRRKVEMSEAKLRSIISSAPAGIGLFVGRDLVIDMPNQTFIDIVGKGWDVVGKPLREAMPELITYGQPFLKILDDVYTTGKMYQSYGDQVKIEQNGVMTYNYYNITYTPLFNENNEVYAILDIAIDVTEAVNARQKAEETGIALSGAIELAELATWRYNIKENTYSYSKRFMEWLGFSENTTDLDTAYNPLTDDYRQSVPAAIEETIKKGSSGIYRNEHPIINRITGQERIINAQAQVSYDSEGNAEFLTGSARDVTKERKLQQELEFLVSERTKELAEANITLSQNNEALAQFAYITSHDLQEPVRKITIFSKMLENSLSDIDERSVNYIKKIKSSSERMGNLIRDVLQYSQLSKGNDYFVPVSLSTITDELVNDFELMIEQSHATVNYSNLPAIEAIPLQMTQLFGNLISNSLKYTREGVNPVINITASLLPEDEALDIFGPVSGRYHRIVFSDNGIGFEQEYAEKIFNIFQRLHGKTEYSGTGIGLAICKKIVQNHYGHIYATSVEGSGAMFTILLPESQNIV